IHLNSGLPSNFHGIIPLAFELTPSTTHPTWLLADITAKKMIQSGFVPVLVNLIEKIESILTCSMLSITSKTIILQVTSFLGISRNNFRASIKSQHLQYTLTDESPCSRFFIQHRYIHTHNC
ncbi:hypothetical protein PanWU01x14_206040, partial [Parasponia andersonii]